MEKGFYHSSVGYWQTLSTPNEDVRQSYPSGTVEVPLQPSHLHTFNGTEWVAPTQAELDAEAAAQVRGERDSILAQVVDPLVSNPLRWGDLTTEKQAEWTQYRTDLLDVPQQAGFPHDVTWPTSPSLG